MAKPGLARQKQNCCYDVNGRFAITWCVTLYVKMWNAMSPDNIRIWISLHFPAPSSRQCKRGPKTCCSSFSKEIRFQTLGTKMLAGKGDGGDRPKEGEREMAQIVRDEPQKCSPGMRIRQRWACLRRSKYEFWTKLKQPLAPKIKCLAHIKCPSKCPTNFEHLDYGDINWLIKWQVAQWN